MRDCQGCTEKVPDEANICANCHAKQGSLADGITVIIVLIVFGMLVSSMFGAP